MKKVLIANRGEIAVRIIRACHDLGLKTVAVYSEADSESLHVLLADEAVCIGKAPALESYLKIPHIISACEITGADAVHPGYGFLAENANFASICKSCGLIFIGPSPAAIALLGDKVEAKKIAKAAKCPTIPGSPGVVHDIKEGIKESARIGYPIFIKASAGGGGKGIRIAYDDADFAKKFVAAKAEAQANFANSDIYLEKMIVNPRHIEVQILGDHHGHYIHLGERDCTVQRRRQKLIEETPSPVVSDSLRKKIGASALAIAKEAKYFSAGTVEFLLDEKKNYYFMEVNTRIQVEHTVTEELTNVDLVRAQLEIAMGKPLTIKQKEIDFSKAHVIQCRINAEDPAAKFAPSPGVLKDYIAPGGPHVRVDSNCYAGYKIPPNYDSMIAKLIVRGRDRKEAVAIMLRALSEFHITGVKSTIPFHKFILTHLKFLEHDYNLNFIDTLIEEGCTFGYQNE